MDNYNKYIGDCKGNSVVSSIMRYICDAIKKSGFLIVKGNRFREDDVAIYHEQLMQVLICITTLRGGVAGKESCYTKGAVQVHNGIPKKGRRPVFACLDVADDHNEGLWYSYLL